MVNPIKTIKCYDCTFAIEAIRNKRTVFVCSNKNSEFHKALLNINIDGKSSIRPTWRGCTLGKVKAITLPAKEQVKICDTCERRYKYKSATRNDHCRAYTAVPLDITTCWTDNPSWATDLLIAKREYAAKRLLKTSPMR